MSQDTVFEFDWDPAKALSNRRDHGITFEQAATVFLDALALTVYDAINSQVRNAGSLSAAMPVVSCWRWPTRIGRRSPGGPKSASSQRARRPDVNDEAMKRNRDRKTMPAAKTPASSEHMPKEIDFSGGTRGKFYRRNARLSFPVYLDADVQAYLGAIAARKGVPLSELTNDLLKKEIAILKTVDAAAAD
jgi:hypothetical protein